MAEIKAEYGVSFHNFVRNAILNLPELSTPGSILLRNKGPRGVTFKSKEVG